MNRVIIIVLVIWNFISCNKINKNASLIIEPSQKISISNFETLTPIYYDSSSFNTNRIKLLVLINADCSTCLSILIKLGNLVSLYPTNRNSLSVIGFGSNEALFEYVVNEVGEIKFRIYFDANNQFIESNNIDIYFNRFLLLIEKGDIVSHSLPFYELSDNDFEQVYMEYFKQL